MMAYSHFPFCLTFIEVKSTINKHGVTTTRLICCDPDGITSLHVYLAGSTLGKVKKSSIRTRSVLESKHSHYVCKTKYALFILYHCWYLIMKNKLRVFEKLLILYKFSFLFQIHKKI